MVMKLCAVLKNCFAYDLLVNLDCKCACAVNHEYIIKLCCPLKYRILDIRNSL